MRGKVAKALRKLAWPGDLSQRDRKYFVAERKNGLGKMVVSDRQRLLYKILKDEWKAKPRSQRALSSLRPKQALAK